MRPVLTGQRYVVVGLSQVAVRVVALLREGGGDVTVLHGPDNPLQDLLGDAVTRLPSGPDRERALVAADLAGAACVLALGSDDLDNLRTAAAAAVVAPDVPVVLRAFDDSLADELESGLALRRAYSASALSAPAFVAAALGEALVTSLRLGDDEVPLCRIAIAEGSLAHGLTRGQLERQYACTVVAAAGADGRWCQDGEDLPAQVLAGGPLNAVLGLAREASPVGERLGRRRRRDLVRRVRPPRAPTLVPVTIAAVIALVAAAAFVFAANRGLAPVDALYFTVTTVFGDPSLVDAPGWLKLFGIAVTVVFGALIGVIFSHVASIATAARLEQQMGRRARKLDGHVLLAGLGKVGYRVEGLLHGLGVPVAVVDRTPDGAFLPAVTQRTPVLAGDARLPEMLEAAGVRRAVCLIACTDDDLANISACLQARHANPGIRTVARVFDAQLGAHLGRAFGVDVVVSSSEVAAAAFFGAATDERATRAIAVGGLQIAARREDLPRPVTAERLGALSDQGLRVVAVRDPDGHAQPHERGEGLPAGAVVILAGPREALDRLRA